jgi:CHAT domain-containing protein
LLGCKVHSRQDLERDFKTADHLFLQGYIDQPVEIAERGYRDSSRYPDLNWRFRILVAALRIKQGKPEEASGLLPSLPEQRLDAGIRFHLHLLRALAFCNSQSAQQARIELSAAQDEADPEHTAEFKLTTARCSQALGKFNEAYVQFAAAQQSSAQDQFLNLYALLGLGFCSLKQRKYEDAVKWYLLAQDAAAALKAIPYEEIAHGNLGYIYYELGDVYQALQNSQDAAKLAERGGSSSHFEWLLDVGRAYGAIGQWGLAQENYRKALEIALARGNNPIAARCLHNLVRAELEKGNLDRAREYHGKAEQLTLTQKEDLRDLRIDSASIAAAKGDYREAEREFLQLIDEVKDTPLVEWNIEAQLARMYAMQGNPKLADRWYRKSIATMEDVAAHMQQTEFKIGTLDSWPIFDGYIAFLNAQKEPERALQVAQLARSRTLTQELGFTTQDENARAWVHKIQAMLRARRSVLLAYYEAEHEAYAWLVTPNKLEMKALGVNQNDLETLADSYRQEIDQHTSIDSSPAQKKLYQILIAPIAALIPHNAHVILVGDSALYRINFEALVSDVGNPHYWIDDAEIENASSIDLLLAEKRVSRHGTGALIIGAPKQVSPQYPLLPHAHEEVDRVKDQFAPAQRKVFVNAAATPDAYTSSQPSRFKYIEFATHSDASSSDPMQSAIILSPAPGGSFKLFAHDIAETKHMLNAELVSISGCYSIGTVRTSEEGLLGLQWAFMRAGAHQVVAGLWDVDDKSSPQLMGGLYSGIVHGQSAAAALRAAKRKMIHATQSPPAPYFWASLQLYTGL